MLRNPDAPADLIDLTTGARVRMATMDQDQSQGIDWGGIIGGSTDSFLRIYSTVTQKPIAQEQPNSVMDYIVGTDYGRTGGGFAQAPAMGGATMVLLLGVGVLAIWALTRK